MSYEKMSDKAYSAAGWFRRKSLQSALGSEFADMHSTLGVQHISSREYRCGILPYWKSLGRRPRRFWFELFGSKDGIIDPEFVPADIYYTELLPYINSFDLYYASSDKCYQDYWFPEVRQAQTVCRRISGLYFDAAMHMIPEREAVRLCLGHEGGLVIKPSVYSSNSFGIHMVDPSCCDEEEILGIFNDVGADLIAQDRIMQHPRHADLNPASVNTVRVNSSLTGEGLCIPSSSIRVGAPGEARVSVGSGGFFAEILDDDSLSRNALIDSVEWKDPGRGREEKMQHTMKWTADGANGRYDAGFRIPAMDKIRSQVRMLHPRLAHFRWIGWDWTVDEEGEPVLIEFNGSPGIIVSQMISARPVFGEMTGWILEDYFIHRTWEKQHRKGFVYR